MSSQAEVLLPSNEQLWADCSQLIEASGSGEMLVTSGLCLDVSDPYMMPRILGQQVTLKRLALAEHSRKQVITAGVQTYIPGRDESTDVIVSRSFFGLIHRPDGTILASQHLDHEAMSDLNDIGRSLLGGYVLQIARAVRYHGGRRWNAGQGPA